MKRSEMVSAIAKELRTWEGSQLNKKTARQILTAIEKLGMRPPPCVLEEVAGVAFLGCQWEPEKPKKDAGNP